MEKDVNRKGNYFKDNFALINNFNLFDLIHFRLKLFETLKLSKFV